MKSTTATRRELVDFLWEWANNYGDWSKLLVNLIVQKEDVLTISERNNVFDYFLQSIGLKKGLPSLTISKPIFTPTTKKIRITSLSEVKGVNKLAENQTINFGENLTLIYGENGTGKTGYGRILKSLGFSYESNNVIYADIDNSKVPHTAIIQYHCNGIPNTFTWDGESPNIDLQTISVFNNNCVNISLNESRELIVSPLGFHLFNLITNELSGLSKMLEQTIDEHPTSLNWSDNLSNGGTPQYNFIKNISAKSTEKELLEVALFTSENEKELIEKESDLKNLNKTLLENIIKSFTTQVTEFNDLIQKIEDAQKNLTMTNWEEIKKCNKKIEELEKVAKKGLEEIVGSRGIEFYKSVEFTNFLKSADNYIKILGKANYPNDNDDVCIYCRQLLDNSSKELLSNYKQLLNDTTQAEIATYKKIKTNIASKIKNIDTALIFHQPTFGLNDKQEITQPDKILQYNQKVSNYKLAITSDTVDNGVVFELEYSDYIQPLKDKKEQIIKLSLDSTATLDNMSIKEKELNGIIAELKDRRLLSTKIEEVKKFIANKKIIALLESSKSKFSTNSISRKTTEARQELVNQNFVTKFEQELKSFRKSQIKIELNFGTSKGQSKIQQRMNSSYYLKDILSEGEQKAIALAEFLTELQLDSSVSPVVFDDPVNSLDHNIIDDVARRLIKLSNDRQVVIFTHSVLLFNSIMYLFTLPPNKILEHKFYDVKTEFGKTGVISSAEEEINKVNNYIKKINTMVNNTPKGQSEGEIASNGYGYLRSAIELCVEHEIFQGTVKRYQKNIALSQFVKVDGNLLNQHKDELNEIFERSCGYINGHSSPIEIHNEPKLHELKTDFEGFKTIRNAFIA